jgi:hypothetical protein
MSAVSMPVVQVLAMSYRIGIVAHEPGISHLLKDDMNETSTI